MPYVMICMISIYITPSLLCLALPVQNGHDGGARRGQSGVFPLGSAPALRVRKIHDMTLCPTSPSVAPSVVLSVGYRESLPAVPWKS